MDTMFFSFALAISIGALGLLAGRYLWPTSRKADQLALTATQAEAARLANEIANEKGRSGALTEEIRQKSDALALEEKKCARQEEHALALDLHIKELTNATADAKAAQAIADEHFRKESEEVARLAEREASTNKLIASLEDQLNQLTAANELLINSSKATGEEVAR